NHFIAANLLKAMDAQDAKVAILVTGGFHERGVAQALASAGVTTLTYSPKITKIEMENGSAYLSVFARQKTPLEKLLKGERLFLADDPNRGGGEAPVLYGGIEAIRGIPPRDINRGFHERGGRPDESIKTEITSSDEENSVTVSVQSPRGSA